MMVVDVEVCNKLERLTKAVTLVVEEQNKEA
jgi:hypothetical protein